MSVNMTNPKNSNPAQMAQDTQPKKCNVAHTPRSGKKFDNQVSISLVTTH